MRFQRRATAQDSRCQARGGLPCLAVAGRTLGDLHVGYQHVKPHELEIADSSRAELPDADRYRVTQMKFAGKRGTQDKGSIVYKDHLTLHGVPA